MKPNRSPLLLLACLVAASANAQDRGTLDPKPLPPLAHPDDPATPAKELFGRRTRPNAMEPSSIGFYSKGCLAGGGALPIDGATWQVMRLSRNRNWGNPALVSFLERLSGKVPGINGWPGLLVGDMSQPRGGPMITGHASHQIGLDADVWLTPMPDHRLSRADREEMSATNLVRADGLDVDPKTYTLAHLKLIKATSQQPEVTRIFVNPAIKRALCRDAGRDRDWLTKVRPMWGHNYHYHIRLSCEATGQPCRDQDPPADDDGCGAELDRWFAPAMLHPRPGKPRPPMTLAQLPAQCRQVLVAP
jgi:penicillin-insensitive murein endopeptidase